MGQNDTTDENEYEIVILSPKPTTEVTYPNPPVETLYGSETKQQDPTVSLEKKTETPTQTQTQTQTYPYPYPHPENNAYNEVYYNHYNQFNAQQQQQQSTYTAPEQVQYYYPPQSVIQIPQQTFQAAPTPTIVYPSVLVTVDEAQRRRDFRDLCFASLFFVLGFFFWFPWIFGACFFRSKSKPAKALGSSSIFLACFSFIFAVIFVLANGSSSSSSN
eukprot:TRINITY_DN3637_c0_g2_i1.p1 TRINITY_DN3637_c0_g2~~TRINITY_DN3637_c0_g2_i1.p1  ORF type:complete len:217 (+),score=48.29 TRINITY_DN3637_c0_g2_i1:263-913(+)